jgi:hypothetical protein
MFDSNPNSILRMVYLYPQTEINMDLEIANMLNIFITINHNHQSINGDILVKCKFL